MPDLLGLAVSGIAYWLSVYPPRSPLTVCWHVARHPCDGEPYVAGVWFD